MGETMRAVRLFSPGDVRCVRVPVPKREEADDVLVRVKSCGVCGSDIPRVMSKGAYYHPITIGHEFAGEVAEAGAEACGLVKGDRVTVMPLIPCGKCDYCRMGDFVLCDGYLYYGSRVEGAMAEYVRVKAANVLKLPDALDFESASMTDPASIALHAVRRFRILPGQRAMVFGLGAIGLFAVQWLKILGCRSIFAADVFEEKLAQARELGAAVTLNAKKEDVVEAVKRHTDGAGIDLVIELAGNRTTQLQSIQVAAKRGRVIFCGISYDDLTLPSPVVNRILRYELEIEGSWNSSIAPLPINEWKSALEYMAQGSLRALPLITHRFALEDCARCFEMLSKRTELFTKVLFLP